MMSQANTRTLIIGWLIGCIGLIISMVVLGGLTRLTESGLSMTGWAPITGWFPPLTETAWLDELQRYRQSPQYQLINKGMSVGEFKAIFWLEYLHRVLGRITGLFCLLPVIWFSYRRVVSVQYLACFWGIVLGVILQGVIGWFMVKSGLKDAPYVSPLWLSFHLGTACFLLSFTFLVLLRFVYPEHTRPATGLSRWLGALVWLVYIQIILGGLVAGYDAGLIYNSFPLMNGQWIPDDVWHLTPWYHNFLWNITTVQLQHRLLAFLIVILVVMINIMVIRKKFLLTNQTKYVTSLPLAGVVMQFLLGVMTLVYHVPIGLASLHQLGAIILLLIVIWAWYKVGIKEA